MGEMEEKIMQIGAGDPSEGPFWVSRNRYKR
jgi:hypothetical protein